MGELTHFNEQGRARMVDVTEKAVTCRRAVAAGEIHMAPETLEKIKNGTMKKGDVLAVAQVAGIQAAKHNWELIPMCHPLPLTGIDITFALSDHMVRSILEHEQWNERSRLAIIDFIETYQTAYALKRLDYLQSVFSDDALIIVGKVLAPATHLEGQYIPPRVRQNRLSKETYMRNLKACFAAQEYINLKFADINIVRAGKGGEIYGIQMQQDYFSTTYGDTGYLFLHVDLNDPDRPIIHVRTWQPEKDPVLGAYNMGNLGL